MNNIEEIFDSKKCCGCSACVNVCPVDAIEMIEKEGFLFPKVNAEKCVGCGKCIKVCDSCKELKPTFCSETPKKIFTFTYLDEQVLHKSSSGGFFYWLCQYVLQKGGIVCSPAFDDEWYVNHIFVECEEKIPRVQGSKYVQSDKKTVHKEIEKYLREGRTTLFSGTPCEIAGLKNVLTLSDCNIEKLICCEVICRAGTSPVLFDKFIQCMKSKYGKINSINFREKSYGYQTPAMVVRCKRKVYRESYDNGLFLPAFFGGYSIRESCTSCLYKTLKSNADFTIGDYWEGTAGTTLISSNSAVAIQIMQEIPRNDEIKLNEVSLGQALEINGQGDARNGRWIYSSEKAQESNIFLKDMEEMDVEDLRKKYYPQTLRKWVKKILRPIRYKLKLGIKMTRSVNAK